MSNSGAVQRPAIDVLRDALERIANPVPWEEANLRDGYEIDWPMLLHMLEDPEYYRRAAREALAETQRSRARKRSVK